MAVLLAMALLITLALFPGAAMMQEQTPFQSPLATNIVHEPLVLGADQTLAHPSTLENNGIPLYVIIVFLVLLLPSAGLIRTRRRH